jgi:hypothetical protein
MTQLEEKRPAAQGCHRRRDGAVAVAAAAAAAATWWVLTRVAAVDLAVRSGSGAREVGVVPVVVTALVVALAAAGLLRWLERRSSHAARTWSGIALAVLAVSLAGPLGAVSLAAGAGLAVLHLVVGAVVVVGLRAGCCGPVA